MQLTFAEGSIEIVIDRVIVKADTSVACRLADSVETALKMAQERVGALTKDEQVRVYSEQLEISPRAGTAHVPRPLQYNRTR